MSTLDAKDKWDQRFLALAFRVATWSKDPDMKVGAVLVSPSKRQFSIGYNGYVRGALDLYVGEAEEKLRDTVHAELNALLNAKTDLNGWTLYATKFPCVECAKAVIQAGIDRVVAVQPGTEDSKWAASQRAAYKLMEHAAIAVRLCIDDDAP